MATKKKTKKKSSKSKKAQSKVKKKVASKKSAPKKTIAKGAKKKATSKKTTPSKTKGKSTSLKKKAKVSSKTTPKGKTASKAKAAKKSTVKPASKKAPTKFNPKPMKTLGPIPWNDFFSPLDDRVVVERAQQRDRTPGGLFIPDTVSERQNNEGVVVVAGRGHRDSKKGHIKPLDVAVGDTVVFGPYAGSDMELNGVDVVIIRESDILGIKTS